MNLGKIATVSVVIIGITVFSLYFVYEGNSLNNFEDNQDEEIEFIEWPSNGLFKTLVDPNDVIIRSDGKPFPLKATFVLKNELAQTYNEISVFGK